VVVGYFHFASQVHRLRNERDERTARPEACFYLVRGAAELDSPHEHAPLYTPVQRFQPQAGESCSSHGLKLFCLQFHQDSPYTADESGNGGWRHRSAVERRGLGSSLGSLRAAEGGKSGSIRRDDVAFSNLGCIGASCGDWRTCGWNLYFQNVKETKVAHYPIFVGDGAVRPDQPAVLAGDPSARW
jgi:hypothetical protein